MKCVVTAGPTFESLDRVRRLTNFSTGRLGSELSEFLTGLGHEVVLLLGEQATFSDQRQGKHTQIFSTTSDLRDRLKAFSSQGFQAVFHAAAVSDFSFGKIWRRTPQGELTEVKSGKLSTREGTLLAELVPTQKIIAELRNWYPQGLLVGWKFEVDGNQQDVLALAKRQIQDCSIDACVANGPAYGDGFAVVDPAGHSMHIANKASLFSALQKLTER